MADPQCNRRTVSRSSESNPSFVQRSQLLVVNCFRSADIESGFSAAAIGLVALHVDVVDDIHIYRTPLPIPLARASLQPVCHRALRLPPINDTFSLLSLIIPPLSIP